MGWEGEGEGGGRGGEMRRRKRSGGVRKRCSEREGVRLSKREGMRLPHLAIAKLPPLIRTRAEGMRLMLKAPPSRAALSPPASL
jgi:hypothetical protein